jgi:hypothetical protein
VQASVRGRWVDSGENFYCPVGHSQHYTESTVQKLEKELAREKRSREFYQSNATYERSARERTERRLRATKGAKTRIVNRIKNGVCPCCNRTFINLGQHMKTQHPDFQKQEDDSPSTTRADHD